MLFRALGSVDAIADDGSVVTVPAGQQRTLLAVLLAGRGTVIGRDVLIEALWPDELPQDPRNGLQHYVARLRALLGASWVRSTGDGYELVAGAELVDAGRFEALVDQGRSLLARGRPAQALQALDRGLELWRGEPFSEIPGTTVAAERARLSELHEAAVEDRLEARLADAADGAVIPELAEAVEAEPSRERRWGQLMRALYRAGRQADALGAYQRARRYLGDELGLEPSPGLQNLELQILRHDPALAPGEVDPSPARQPATSLGASWPTTHRPRPPRSSFIGRAADVRALHDLLAGERLVTVRGPVGVGKTRLVLEWAAQVVDEHQVAVAELAPVARDRLVVPTIVGSLRIPEDPTSVPVERLVTQLQRRTLTLVLDGCDRSHAVLRSMAERVLSECPGVRLLLTSQSALGLPDEVQLPLEGLSVTPGTDGELADGVQLFVDRARLHRADFRVTATDVETISAIVDAVGGLPLAIELAAGRVRSAALADIYRGLVSGRESFPAVAAEVATRHASLHAALDWSLSLLPPAHHRALEQLAVLPGPFSMPTAQAVVGAPQDLVSVAVDDLVARGLVHARRGPAGAVLALPAATRRHLLDTMPATEGHLSRARGRALVRYETLAAGLRDGLFGPEQLAWLARGDAEADGLAAAVTLAVDLGTPVSAVRIAACLGGYWDWRGLVAQAHDSLVNALDADEGSSPGDTVSARVWAAFFAWEAGDLTGAYGMIDAARIAAKAGGAPNLDAAVEGTAALVASTAGRPSEAAGGFRAAIDLATAAGNHWYAAWAAVSQVPCELHLGDDRAAARLGREALDTFRRLGDRRGEGWALLARAQVLEHRDDLPGAQAASGDAVLMAHSVFDARTVAAALELRARVALAQDRPERAAQLLAAVDAMQLRRGVPGPPSKDIAHTDRLVDLEDQLGHIRFTTAWQEGATADVIGLAFAD